jgi:hypothetical protein
MFKRKVIVVVAACADLVPTSCKTEAPKFMDPAISTPVVAVAVPARAGAVEGKTENSDAFIWELFTQITAPVTSRSASAVEFERWASDVDTSTSNPHWPTGPDPLRFHASVLRGCEGFINFRYHLVSIGALGSLTRAADER